MGILNDIEHTEIGCDIGDYQCQKGKRDKNEGGKRDCFLRIDDFVFGKRCKSEKRTDERKSESQHKGIMTKLNNHREAPFLYLE